MKFDPPSEQQIKYLFDAVGLGPVTDIQKIEIGFSNHIYAINNRYVLKTPRYTDESEIDLRKEIYLSNLVRDVVPAPTIVHADESRRFFGHVFIIYEKIGGENLYLKWHVYSVEERRAMIMQICEHVRAIAALPYDEFITKFSLEIPTDWETFIVRRIEETIPKVVAKDALPPELEAGIRAYIAKHRSALRESKLALLYVDPHFDNFLVRDGKIVAMLDFESMNVRSIDWVLHLVQRMEQEPRKYAHEAIEDDIDPADYTHLMEWYREFYPELFAFTDMDTRLNLYAIKHNLTDLEGWPHVESLRANVRRILAP